MSGSKQFAIAGNGAHITLPPPTTMEVQLSDCADSTINGETLTVA
jgi:hypothetical protein